MLVLHITEIHVGVTVIYLVSLKYIASLFYDLAALPDAFRHDKKPCLLAHLPCQRHLVGLARIDAAAQYLVVALTGLLHGKLSVSDNNRAHREALKYLHIIGIIVFVKCI